MARVQDALERSGLGPRPDDTVSSGWRTLQLKLEIRAQASAERREGLTHAVGVRGRLQPRILAVDVEREQPAHIAGLGDEFAERSQAVSREAPGCAFRPEPGQRAAVEDDG
jgi:hypothetical protein